jgi:hypothetical protein
MSTSVSPSPSVKFETVMILSLSSGLGIFKGDLFPDFQKTVNCELLIMVVQELEDIFSIERTNFRDWL